jgi:hypothetical protein
MQNLSDKTTNPSTMKSRPFFLIVFFSFCLLGLSLQAQDQRADQFGPLFDGSENSYDKLISQGWIYLFDGRLSSPEQTVEWSPLSLWRPRRADRNNCWLVIRERDEDEYRILTNILREGMHGTDLITNMEFRDFDLHVEFRSAENSGIYLRGRYEVQIDAGDPDKEDLKFSDLGGIYALSPPSVNASKNPDEWQTFDISIRDYAITVYLNGMLIQDKVKIPEGKRRVGTGTELGCWVSDGFHNDPSKAGPIMIQGNHGQADFKNIRIRPQPVQLEN